MNDRIAIITGSNSGIGKETALALAKMNYTVIMGCRNIKDGKIICEEIKQKTKNDNVYLFELDLCSFSSIRIFVNSIKAQYSKIDLLINNAGITTQKYEITDDGYERTMQTNLLGPYILTTSLLPYFDKENDARIVNVCSDFYKFGRFKINSINDYHWIKAYAASKYAVLLMTLELANKYLEKGITVNAVHPGVVRTKIMLTKKWYDVIINFILSGMYIDEVEGAKTSIYVATASELKDKTGGYYIKNKNVEIPRKYNDFELRKELFEYCDTVYSKYQE